MKIYLSANFSRKAEILALVPDLEQLGHQVTSTWLTRAGSDLLSYEALELDPDLRPIASNIAREDEIDVRRAQILVLFTEPARQSRGGKHVEMGIAIGTGKPVHVIGSWRENIFHYQRNVMWHDTWTEFLIWIGDKGGVRSYD